MNLSDVHEPLLVGYASNSEGTQQSTVIPFANRGATKSTNGSLSSSLDRVDRKHFKSAQWSPDGTTILTSSADNNLSSFILPTDLLSPPHPHTLRPYSAHTCPEPVYATIFHPSYSLSDSSTCLILASLRSLPLRLISPFAPSILASYPLISPTTEAYITPHSLLFNPEQPTQFFAGSDSCISLFDINRNGEGPFTHLRTTHSRRSHNIYSPQSMKGLISALAISNDGILAAGTFTRSVSLYDGRGHGDTISVFSLRHNLASKEQGQGITQLFFTPCSHYLLIAERKSDGISVYDIRGDTSGKPLAWLQGRKAETQQRLSVDLVGSEVWAGGTDGMVRVWERVGMVEGVMDPSWGFKAHHDVVSSAGLHPTGSVLATCSGQRHWGWSDEGGGSEDEVSKTADNSLKVLAL